MAAPKEAPEQAFRLRKFQGTNTEIESTFLGPSVVSLSQNWIPTQSFRLGKRPGTALFQHVTDSGRTITEITALCRNRDVGRLFLYAYAQTSDGTAHVYQSIDEAPFGLAVGADFPTGTAIGRMVGFRDRVYAGNGVDPIKSWKLGDPSANTQTYGAITDLGDPPTVTHNTVSFGEALPTGTYQYCWGRIDTATGLYLGRTKAGTVVVKPNESITFPLLATHPPTARTTVSSSPAWLPDRVCHDAVVDQRHQLPDHPGPPDPVLDRRHRHPRAPLRWRERLSHRQYVRRLAQPRHLRGDARPALLRLCHRRYPPRPRTN
jgi:hypothetical protein